MRITVLVDGERYDVEIDKLPFQDAIDHVTVNGKPVEIAMGEDWLRHFSKNLIVGGQSYQIEFEKDSMGIPRTVWALGQAVEVTLDFPGKGKLRRPEMRGLWREGDHIRAGLPGKIIGVRVRPGQDVKSGELLCLLEAMKMENEITSPRDGKVKEVLVQEGERVELDQVLITLEEQLT